MQLTTFIFALWVVLIASCPPPLNRWEYADNTTLLVEVIEQLDQIGFDGPVTGWTHQVDTGSPLTTWPTGLNNRFVRISYCFHDEEARKQLEKQLKAGWEIWRRRLGPPSSKKEHRFLGVQEFTLPDGQKAQCYTPGTTTLDKRIPSGTLVVALNPDLKAGPHSSTLGYLPES